MFGVVRALVDGRIPGLTDAQFRVAVTIARMAVMRDGMTIARVTTPTLSVMCGTNRTTLRRSLDRLCESGFCRVSAYKDHTSIEILWSLDTGHLEVTEILGVSVEKHELSDTNTSQIRTGPTANSGHPKNIAQPNEMLCVSLADLGDRGHPDCENPDRVRQFSGHFDSGPRARDLDLLRSSGSGSSSGSPLRSLDLQDLSRSEEYQISGRECNGQHKGETVHQSFDGTAFTDSQTDLFGTRSAGRQQTPAEPDHPPEASGKSPKIKRTRINPEAVPERAWSAADYLREQVVTENPASFAAAASWEAGWAWTTGSAVRESDGGRSGLRLTWANSFRLIHTRLVKALRNAEPYTTEEQAWQEIARTVHWLFHSQPSDPRFVVHSPDALSAKWDRIQEARKRQRNKPLMGANGKPDPVQKPERVVWK